MSAIKPHKMLRHTGYVLDVAHLPSRQHIITCSGDASLRLWDLDSSAQIGKDWRDDREETMIFAIALSPNCKAIATGSSDGTVTLWDVERRKVIARWTGHTAIVRSVCWSADGERVLSGSYDGTVRVWDVEIGKTVLGPIKTGHENVTAAIYSHDTTKIATGGGNENNGVKIWDAKTGKLLSTILIEHGEQGWSLAWTKDDKLISGDNGSITIYDTATWQQVATLEGHKDGVETISLFHNDRLLASTSWDNTVRLWNLDSNLPVGPPLQHEGHVYATAISTDGKLLVTGCGDKNVYVWDIHAILRDVGLEDLLSIPDVSLNTSVIILYNLIDYVHFQVPRDGHKQVVWSIS